MQFGTTLIGIILCAITAIIFITLGIKLKCKKHGLFSKICFLFGAGSVFNTLVLSFGFYAMFIAA